MTRRALWFDHDNEHMGVIPMSMLTEWFKTARRDLLLRIGNQTHTVGSWIDDPELLAAHSAGPNLLERTFAKSVSFHDIFEGGWRSGKKLANCAYYMSPAVITEGTVYVVQITTIKPLRRIQGWRLRRRAVSAAATAPPRRLESPVFVDSQVIEPSKVINL